MNLITKKITKHTYTNLTVKNDLKLFDKRASSVDLIWCKQVFNIIQNHINTKKVIKINDLGCNYFQFYKEIKRRDALDNFDYKGYDIDSEFIGLGLKHFPELKRKCSVSDIEDHCPRKADLTIISATLEHAPNPERFLNNAIASTSSSIILRTFLADTEETYFMDNKNYVLTPYYINQFSMLKVVNKFLNNGYSVEIMRDEATDFSSSYELFKGSGLRRQMFIIFAKKSNNRMFT